MENTNVSTSKTLTAVLIAAVGVIFYSAKAVFVKLAYVYDVDAITLMLYRMLFAIPFYLGVWSLHRKKNPKATLKLERKDVVLTIFLGFIGYYLSTLFDFVGLKYIDASLERLILFVYPTIVVFLSYFALKKKPTKAQLGAIVLTYLGVFIVFGQGIQSMNVSSDFWWGVFFIFCCALTYATYLVGINKLLPKYGTVAFTTNVMLISSAIVVLHYFVQQGFDWKVYPWQVYVYSLLMATISTVLPSYLISEAIRRIGANTVGVVGSLGPVSTITLAMIFLGEQLTYVQIIGAAVILVGIYLVSKSKDS